MKSDPVIDELHRVKDEIAKEFNYDIHALFESLREEQKVSGRNYVSFEKPKAAKTKTRKVKAKKTATARKTKRPQRSKTN
jgi:hypothetical protein